jgi:flavin reductase (DIM6/NTAB) family NADH-FMN oxidoreductase RutF
MSEYENNLRSAFSKFPTGVTVVTTRDSDGTPRGFTANAFTSVSLDPPMLLICIAKSAYSMEIFTQADGFAVNILSEAQREVSGVFASKRADKFSTIEYSDGPAGHPLLAGTCAWFDCHLGECVDAGDHIILLGNIAGYHSTAENPLGFAQRGYFSLGLTYEAVDAAVRAVKPRISAIIEYAGALLLIPDPKTGVLGLPTGDRYGPGAVASSLLGVLQALGVSAQLEFLYSVYEESSGTQVINYHGHAAGRDCLEGSFVEFDDIPWQQLSNEPLRTMLQRYVREHQQEAFGLYVGDDLSGDVRAVPNT